MLYDLRCEFERLPDNENIPNIPISFCWISSKEFDMRIGNPNLQESRPQEMQCQPREWRWDEAVGWVPPVGIRVGRESKVLGCNLRNFSE